MNVDGRTCYLTGKRKFAHHSDAEVFMDQKNIMGRWYRCPNCDHFHITTDSKDIRRFITRR